MKIQVEERHIQQGDCKIPQRCMIAAAIKEFDSTISYVAVRTNGITITKRRKDGNGVREHWSVPISAARAIIRFDAGEPVTPFAFNAKMIDQITIKPVPLEQRKKDAKKTKARRQKLEKAGIPVPKYGRRSRVAGI